MTEAILEIPITIKISQREANEFIRDVILNVDMFMQGYIGYWACRMDAMTDEKQKGSFNKVLIREEDDCDPLKDKGLAEAKRIFEMNTGEKLPEGFHELNYDVALKIIANLYILGSSIEDYDGNSIDVATQIALLGEEVYC